jgi:hypothetical protein
MNIPETYETASDLDRLNEFNGIIFYKLCKQ